MMQIQHAHDFYFYLRWASGPVGTFVLGIAWWLVKKLTEAVKAEWAEMDARLKRIEDSIITSPERQAKIDADAVTAAAKILAASLVAEAKVVAEAKSKE